MGSQCSNDTTDDPEVQPTKSGPKTLMIDTQLENGFPGSTNPATVAATPSPSTPNAPVALPAFLKRKGYPREETKEGHTIRTFRPLPWAT